MTFGRTLLLGMDERAARHGNRRKNPHALRDQISKRETKLGGGFKDVLFSSLLLGK